MGRHARMKRFKSNDPFNPKLKAEKQHYLKPPKDKDINLNPYENGFGKVTKRKKSKNKFKKQEGETDFRHIQRLNQDIQFEIFKAEIEPQQEPELDGNKKLSERKTKHKERLKTKKHRLRERKEEKFKELDAEKRWTDQVQFGEVVMAPPELRSKPRMADKITNTKNKNKNLLLAQKFKTTDSASLARQKLLMDERERVIQAYRDIKQQKLNEQK